MTTVTHNNQPDWPPQKTGALDIVDKIVPNYTPDTGSPPTNQNRCGTCRYFVEGGSCAMVEGVIDPVKGICKFYEGGQPLPWDTPVFPVYEKTSADYHEEPYNPYLGEAVTECGCAIEEGKKTDALKGWLDKTFPTEYEEPKAGMIADTVKEGGVGSGRRKEYGEQKRPDSAHVGWKNYGIEDEGGYLDLAMKDYLAKKKTQESQQLEWDESKHPRDEEGRFSSTGNARIDTEKNVINSHIKFLRSQMIQIQIPERKPFEAISDAEREARYFNSRITKRVNDLEAELKATDQWDERLPNIPAKPNTHPINQNGWADNGHTVFDVKLDADSYHDQDNYMQTEMIKIIWNNFSDEERDLVNTLHISPFSSYGEDSSNLGSWQPAAKRLHLSVFYAIGDREIRGAFRHEMAHATYHHLLEQSPHNIQTWQDSTISRAAPTEYSAGFRKRWKDFEMKEKDYFKPPPIGNGPEGKNPEETAIVRRNVKLRRDLYFNELHSAVSEAMYGLSGKNIRKDASKDISKKMEPFIEAYKELHEL